MLEDKRMTKYAYLRMNCLDNYVGCIVITKIFEHISFSSGALWLERWQVHISQKKTRTVRALRWPERILWD